MSCKSAIGAVTGLEVQPQVSNGESVFSKLRRGLAKRVLGQAESAGQAEDRIYLARVLKGERDAYQFIVEKYRDKAFAIAYSIVRSKDDAEDIVQESFVKAYLSLKEYRGDSAFYTWFYRIVYNMSLDVKRRHMRSPIVEAAAAGAGSIETAEHNSDEPRTSLDKLAEANRVYGPHEELYRKQQARKISEVLGAISDEHRTVIMLREVDGLSYEEIARIVGVSKGTVMSRLHYARKKLQEVLHEFAPEGWKPESDPAAS